MSNARVRVESPVGTASATPRATDARAWLERLRARPLAARYVLLVVVLYLCATQNSALWALARNSLVQPSEANGAMLYATLAAILMAGTYTVAALLCIGPMLRLNLALLIVIAVVCNHFMSRYGVVIDTQMLINATRTNLHEAGELLTADLQFKLLVSAGLPVLLLYAIRIRRDGRGAELLWRIGIGALLWALAATVLIANYKEAALWSRLHAEVRKYPNPVYPLISVYKLAQESLIVPASAAELRAIAGHVAPRVADGRRRIVVMIVGETARADHLSLYGYARQTNPQLAAIGTLARFDSVQACGTSTAVSVPCMFSRLGHDGFDRKTAEQQQNLLDVLAAARVAVLWRENNTGCQGVCRRVETEDLSSAADAALCSGGECRDEILLAGLRERVLAGDGDRLVVLHQLGSHGPSYYKRYPSTFAAFTPECTLDEAYRCDRGALVNSYDNTILYTDHLVSEVIHLLDGLGADVDAAMLYVSDHGESLGESGLYLHGFPYALAPEAQTRVPMLAWFSPRFEEHLRIDRNCLDAQTQRSLSHDNVFDIVLGLFGVDTDAYRPVQDVVGQCEGRL